MSRSSAAATAGSSEAALTVRALAVPTATPRTSAVGVSAPAIRASDTAALNASPEPTALTAWTRGTRSCQVCEALAAATAFAPSVMTAVVAPASTSATAASSASASGPTTPASSASTRPILTRSGRAASAAVRPGPDASTSSGTPAARQTSTMVPWSRGSNPPGMLPATTARAEIGNSSSASSRRKSAYSSAVAGVARS